MPVLETVDDGIGLGIVLNRSLDMLVLSPNYRVDIVYISTNFTKDSI